jgi:hypothetical protein
MNGLPLPRRQRRDKRFLRDADIAILTAGRLTAPRIRVVGKTAPHAVF